MFPAKPPQNPCKASGISLIFCPAIWNLQQVKSSAFFEPANRCRNPKIQKFAAFGTDPGWNSSNQTGSCKANHFLLRWNPRKHQKKLNQTNQSLLSCCVAFPFQHLSPSKKNAKLWRKPENGLWTLCLPLKKPLFSRKIEKKNEENGSKTKKTKKTTQLVLPKRPKRRRRGSSKASSSSEREAPAEPPPGSPAERTEVGGKRGFFSWFVWVSLGFLLKSSVLSCVFLIFVWFVC